MGRGNQVTRQWNLIKTLDGSRRGVSINDLAVELNCTPRTVYRDLDDLQAAGFPITSEMLDGVGYWQFVDGYRVSLPTPFSITELMSLYLSRDLLKSLEGTFFYDSIQDLLSKIRAQLSPELKGFLKTTEQAFAADPGPSSDYKAHREILHLLNDACLKRETVKFRYYSRKNETSTRKVNPYKVYFYEGTLYLIGYDHNRKGIRMFVVGRIQLLQNTGENFTMPVSFDVRDFLKHSFGVMQAELSRVVVRVDASIARFVAEKKWHSSQKVIQNKDGSSDFVFEIAGHLELKRWVLGMGSLAWVIEPRNLIEEIVIELEHSLQNYRNPLKQQLRQNRRRS